MSGTLAPRPENQQISFDLAGARCARVLTPVVLAAQMYDMVNTRDQMTRYPDARETDWWSRIFAGPHGRNLGGIVLGVALLDAIKWKLTAHSPALRCAAEANQLETTLDAIRITRPL